METKQQDPAPHAQWDNGALVIALKYAYTGAGRCNWYSKRTDALVCRALRAAFPMPECPSQKSQW